MSAHRDCCSRSRDFGQMLCIEHIASFWCFRYDKQGNSPVGGKIDLVIQLRGAAEIDFQKERRNDETKTAISCSCLCHDGRSAHRRRGRGGAGLRRQRGALGRRLHRALERAWYRSGQQRRVCPPNGQFTCAQLASILAKLLKLPAAENAGFADNSARGWFFDAINRCAAAGILKGNGDGTVSPNAPIARERAMVILGRAMGIEPIENPDLTKYADAAQVVSNNLLSQLVSVE